MISYFSKFSSFLKHFIRYLNTFDIYSGVRYIWLCLNCKFFSIVERFLNWKARAVAQLFSTMAPNTLQFLVVNNGQYSKWERIGTLIVGALAFIVFVWLVVLSGIEIRIGSNETNKIGNNLLKCTKSMIDSQIP